MFRARKRSRKKNKKKINNQEERTKQKIFQLTEITIPETITVKDLSTELKKTSSEIIKKLFGYGIMATINNEIDFDTAFFILLRSPAADASDTAGRSITARELVIAVGNIIRGRAIPVKTPKMDRAVEVSSPDSFSFSGIKIASILVKILRINLFPVSGTASFPTCGRAFFMEERLHLQRRTAAIEKSAEEISPQTMPQTAIAGVTGIFS